MFMFGIHWKMWIENTHFTMPFTKAQHDSIFSFSFFTLFTWCQMMNLNARFEKQEEKEEEGNEMVNRWIKTCNFASFAGLHTPCNIRTNHFLNEKQKEGKEWSCDLWIFTFWMTNFSFSIHVFRSEMRNLMCFPCWSNICCSFQRFVISDACRFELNNRNGNCIFFF